MNKITINSFMIIFFICVIAYKLAYRPDVNNLLLAIPVFFIITNILGILKEKNENT